MNPTVICCKEGHNASTFKLVDEEIDSDGTQTLMKQYYHADCGCMIEVTLAVPNTAAQA